MYFREFDVIIDTIEEKVDANWRDVEAQLMKKLGLCSGQISSIFKDFYPDDVVISNYFKNRKAYRTMEAIIKSPNESKEEVTLRFGYTDYSLFFKWLKKIYGKNPTQILEEGIFTCPPIVHVIDIISDDHSLFPDNRVTKKEIGDHKWSEMQLVDRITAMRDRISELNKELREETEPKRRGYIEGEIFELNSKISQEEQRLDMQIQEPVVIKSLTPGLYAEFVRIEECRAVYGISINKIIELYNLAVSQGVPLDVLCDVFSEEEFLADFDGDEEYDEYEEDFDMSYTDDEMNLEESWQYYNDDDAIDPYGSIEGLEEYDEIANLVEEQLYGH